MSAKIPDPYPGLPASWLHHLSSISGFVMEWYQVRNLGGPWSAALQWKERKERTDIDEYVRSVRAILGSAEDKGWRSECRDEIRELFRSLRSEWPQLATRPAPNPWA